jgi:hypothetical protein
LLAKNVNDNAGYLRQRGEFFAGKPAPTGAASHSELRRLEVSAERDCCKVCLDSHCPHRVNNHDINHQPLHR